MSEKKTRRLVAIMFTDIVGYTKMMQESESRAARIRDRHRKVFEHFHEKYQGTILQYYGDGTLSIFDSSVDAVNCAIDIQQDLQTSPNVPLRIGIHLGDIVVGEKDVYGDGVNVASRIESLGVPGSILISEDVQKQIKNQDIESISIGSFEMKNVATPMKVYAINAPFILIPQPEEMHGKAKQVEAVASPPSSTRLWIRFASIGFLAMLAGATLFWAFGSRNHEQADLLQEKIRVQRVAAIPFDNYTGDSNLNAFGPLCSSLIINGLTEAGIKTTSPRTVEQYNHLLGVLPGNPEKQVSFAEVTGALYWIEGNFLKQGDTIIIKSHLTDGLTGEVLRNFDDEKGHWKEKEKLAVTLTRKIMSYWVSKEAIDRGKFKPPLYEAYQEYDKIFSSGHWVREHAIKAFEIDSTFYLAILEELNWLADKRDPAFDSLYSKLLPHYLNMTSWEQSLFDATKFLYDRDWNRYVKIREKQFHTFPKDFTVNSFYSYHLALRENQPLKAWKVANTIDWENISDKYQEYLSWRRWIHSFYGLGAGLFDEVIQLGNFHIEREERVGGWMAGNWMVIKTKAFLRSGQVDSVWTMIKEVEKTTPKWSFFVASYHVIALCNDAAEEMLLQDKSDLADNFLDYAIEWVENNPHKIENEWDSLNIFRTYFLKGEYQKALKYSQPLFNLYASLKDEVAVQKYYSDVAINYALSGNKSKAKEMLSNIMPFGAKEHLYYKARIHAMLGEKEEAMQNLQDWRNYWGYSHQPIYYFRYDYQLRNLFDYLPFEEFTRLRD